MIRFLLAFLSWFGAFFQILKGPAIDPRSFGPFEPTANNRIEHPLRHFQDRKLMLLIQGAKEYLQAVPVADSPHIDAPPVPRVPGIAHSSRLSLMGI
jgi:hypothetical protein